jgi:hypothetical protein
MKGFSIGVTTVYITEATIPSWENVIQTNQDKFQYLFYKTSKQLIGETHRLKRLYTSHLMIRFS